MVTLSGKRGAGRDAASVVSIVVVTVAVAVNISKVITVTRIGRAQPPPRSGRASQKLHRA